LPKGKKRSATSSRSDVQIASGGQCAPAWHNNHDDGSRKSTRMNQSRRIKPKKSGGSIKKKRNQQKGTTSDQFLAAASVLCRGRSSARLFFEEKWVLAAMHICQPCSQNYCEGQES
jgi:hypothetical protein